MTPSASPPTERVVEIIELLVSSDEPLRISDITGQLGINRSTCTAILETLERRGWVERREDRTFQAGGGLIPISNKIRGRLPILARADPLIRELAARLDVKGISLSLIEGGHMTQVARAGARDWTDVGPLLRTPVFPPFGAVVVAFGSDTDKELWLSQVGDDSTRAHLRDFLETVRERGSAVWRLDAQTQLITEAIMATHALAPPPGTRRLDAVVDDRLAALLHKLGRLGCTVQELEKAPTLPVSYIEMPVFDVDGRPCYELEMHVLRDAVPHDELQALLAALTQAAQELTKVCAELAG